MTLRLIELKLAKENLKIKELDLRSQEADQEGLKAKIENVLKNLEKATEEKQRPIFTSLVKFIEVRPLKIKLDLYAPTNESGADAGAFAVYAKAYRLKLISFLESRINYSPIEVQ